MSKFKLGLSQDAVERLYARTTLLTEQQRAMLHIVGEVLSAYDAGADGESELEVTMDMLREEWKKQRDGI